jgi:hypothetical protein
MHKFPCVPDSMKFGGNVSYGSTIIHKKFRQKTQYDKKTTHKDFQFLPPKH